MRHFNVSLGTDGDAEQASVSIRLYMYTQREQEGVVKAVKLDRVTKSGG